MKARVHFFYFRSTSTLANDDDFDDSMMVPVDNITGFTQKSDQTLDQVALTPRTLGARTEYTRQFMLQSSIEAENFVRNDLSKGIALEVDRAGLYGTGLAGEPLGVHNVPGISTQAFAAAVAAGGPTFSEVVNMESTMAGDNALMGSPCYIGNAAMLGALKVKAKDSG